MASAATASMNVAHERHSPLRRTSSSTAGLPVPPGSSLLERRRAAARASETRTAETIHTGSTLPRPSSSENYNHLTITAGRLAGATASSSSDNLNQTSGTVPLIGSTSTDSLKIVPGTGLQAVKDSLRSLPGTQTSSHTTVVGRSSSPTPSPLMRSFPSVDSYPERSSFLSTASIANRLATPPPATLAQESPSLTRRVHQGSYQAAVSPSHASSGNRTLTPNSRSNSPAAGQRSTSPSVQVGITLSEDGKPLPRRISPSKQVGAVLPEMSSTMMGYVHLLPMFPDPPPAWQGTPTLPARVIRKGPSGGWALLRATAQKTRLLLAAMVMREWMMALLRRKYTGPLTWIRATRARVMNNLSVVFTLQSVEALMHMFVLQWRLAVSAPSTQVVLEALEGREYQRGPRMRAQLAERRVARSNGALEFLLMILNTHRLERMLHNSLLIWRRNVAAVVLRRQETEERYRVREIHIMRVDVFAQHWQRQCGMLLCKQTFVGWYATITSARETAAAAAEAAREMGYSLEARWSPQVAQLRKQHRSDVCGLLALHSTVEANHLRHACLLWWLHVTRAERQEAQISDLFVLNTRSDSLIRKKEGVMQFSYGIEDRYVPQHWAAHCWQAWQRVVYLARREVLLRSHAEKTVIIDDQRSQIEEYSNRVKDMFAGHEQARHLFRLRIGSVRACIHQFAHRYIQQTNMSFLSSCWIQWIASVNENQMMAQCLEDKDHIIAWFGDSNHGTFAQWLLRTSWHVWLTDAQNSLQLKMALINSRKKQFESAARHIFLLHSDCDQHINQRVFFMWATEVKNRKEARQRSSEMELLAAHRRRRRTTHEAFFTKFDLAEMMLILYNWKAEAAQDKKERELATLQGAQALTSAFREQSVTTYVSRQFNPEAEMMRNIFGQWSITVVRRNRHKFQKSSTHHGRNAAAAVWYWVSSSQFDSGHAKLLRLELLGLYLTSWHLEITDVALAVTRKHRKALSESVVRWTAHMVGWSSTSLQEFTWKLMHMAVLRWRQEAFENATKRRFKEQEQQSVSSRTILVHRHETAMANMEKQGKAALDELQQRHESAVDQLMIQHTITVEDLRRRLSDSEAVGNRQLEETVGDLQRRYADSMSELQNRLAASEARNREWTATLENRVTRSNALNNNTVKHYLAEQAWFRQKILWERWREAIAENRELGLRSGSASQLLWHQNLHDVYSQLVHRRREVLSTSSRFELCFRIWHSQVLISRRDSMILRWRKHHHDVLSTWYEVEQRMVTSNCLASWRQVVDRSIQRRGILSLETMLEKTRSRDYGLLSMVMQAWCAFTGLSMRATATARQQKSVSLRQQIERRWMSLLDDSDKLVCRTAWYAWVIDTRLEKESRRRNIAEARLEANRKRSTDVVGGMLGNATMSWSLHLWHHNAHLLAHERHCEDRNKALRLQRSSTTELLHNKLTEKADAHLAEAFFRVLLGDVATARAATLQKLRHDRAAVLSGELASANMSTYIRVVLAAWHKGTLHSGHSRRTEYVERRLEKTFESALHAFHRQHAKFLLYQSFVAWRQSTDLEAKLGKMEKHRLDQLTAQRLELEAEIDERHRLMEMSAEKHQIAIHHFVDHKLKSVLSVALRGWKHRVNESNFRHHLAQNLLVTTVWTETHFIFSMWYAVASGERQARAEVSKALHLLETTHAMMDRHEDTEKAALVLVIFNRWAALAAEEAYARGAEGFRDQRRGSLQSLVHLFNREKANNSLLVSFSHWTKYVKGNRTAYRRKAGHNILAALGRQEDHVLMRAYFAIWAGIRMKQVVSRTLQTSAELSYWASLQLLARHALNRWMGLVLIRRQIDSETFRMGIQSKIGVCGLIAQVETHRASDIARAVLAAWLHIAVESGRMRQAPDQVQLLSIRRRAMYPPSKMMTERMADIIRSALLVTTWHVWVVSVCDSNVEAHTEYSAIKQETVIEREEYLIGLTLMIWGQEQSLSYARSVLAAWCHRAACANRDAAMKAFGEHVQRQVGVRENEHSYVLNEVLRRFLASGDRECALSCLCAWYRAWYRATSEAMAQRAKEEGYGIFLAQQHGADRTQDIATSVAQQALVELDLKTLLQACILRWHFRAVQSKGYLRERQRKEHQCDHTSGLLDSFVCMHIGLMALTALRAWHSMAAEARTAAALNRVQKDFRRDTRHRVVLAGARAAHLEDGVVRLFCFIGWRHQTAGARLESKVRDRQFQADQAIAQARLMADTRIAEARAVEAVSQMRRSSAAAISNLVGIEAVDDEDLEVAMFGVPLVRSFMAWRVDALGQKRERLQQDLNMILALLQQASTTIEDMRVRFLLARLYGAYRREVLLSWRQVVDFEHTQRLARAPSVLGSDRSGLAGLAAIQAAAQESSRSLVPLTAGSQVSTPLSQASSIKAEAPVPQRESSEVPVGSSAGTPQVSSITQVSPSAYPSSATATPATHSRLIGAGRADFFSTSVPGNSLRASLAGMAPVASGGGSTGQRTSSLLPQATPGGMSASVSNGQRTPPVGGIGERRLSPPRDRSELVRQLQQVRNSLLETPTQASVSGSIAAKTLRGSMTSLSQDLEVMSRPASAKSTNSQQFRF